MRRISDFLTAARRKALYAIGAALFAILVMLGVIDASTSGEWLAILDRVLGLVGLVLAFANTHPETETGPAPRRAAVEETA